MVDLCLMTGKPKANRLALALYAMIQYYLAPSINAVQIQSTLTSVLSRNLNHVHKHTNAVTVIQLSNHNHPVTICDIKNTTEHLQEHMTWSQGQ